MRQFAKKLIAEWRRLELPFKEKTGIVAVSGGADSVSLLSALHELQTAKKINLKLVAAHFNHKLRGAESDSDAVFVKDLAARLGFDSELGSPETEIRNQKGNLEQAARRARYNFLAETAEKFNAFAVLTAHTLDDQAETFLLNLIRGSGSDGLGSMTPTRFLQSEIRNPKSEIRLVRPFLNWARREMTENYCRESGIKFCYDTMNEDEHFARVRVRKQLIPLLKTFNPKIVETLANTADLLREDAEELNAQAEKILFENDFNLLTVLCSQLTVALRQRVLRRWLKLQRGNLRAIDTKHLRAIDSLITRNEGGRMIELPGGESVTRRNGQLIFARKVEKS